MDSDLSIRYHKLLKTLEKRFGEGLDTPAILFLIGINELETKQEKFNKKEKMDLMHVAICTLLEPYGYYDFIGKDKDEWPHFELVKKIPFININEQNQLLMEAILDYFTENNFSKINLN